MVGHARLQLSRDPLGGGNPNRASIATSRHLAAGRILVLDRSQLTTFWKYSSQSAASRL